MGYAQKIATEGVQNEAQIYVLPRKSARRKIAWERVLLPFLLVASIAMYQQNNAVEQRLQNDIRTIYR